MNKNGGLQNTQSKKSATKLKIIGDTPEQTEDLKATIKYLENIIINKNTIKTLNVGELVQNINRLIQCVEVLSIYKKPIVNLIKSYEKNFEMSNNLYLPTKTRKQAALKCEILGEFIGEIQLQENIIQRKDYWESYE